MDGSADRIMHIFSPNRGNLLVILGKWRPPPRNTGRGTSNNRCNGDLWNYSLNKNGYQSPNKVGSSGKRKFHVRACPG